MTILAVENFCGDESLRLIIRVKIKPYRALEVKRLIADRDEYILPPGQFDVDIVYLKTVYE